MSRKTDKECAQQAVAAAMAGETPAVTKRLIESSMTRDEMARGSAYIASGQKVTGKGR
jgi:hypothetical protein